MGNPDIHVTIAAMIKEQGETWLDVLPDRSTTRNAVIVTDNPTHCYRLMFREGQWVTVEDALSTKEMADFFAAFGSHWNILLWSWLEASNSLVRVRAFIASGRKPYSGFSISIDASQSIKTEDQSKAA
jgi:hypothetical protein